MGSRIRSETDHLFEVFFEIIKPPSNEEAPYILQQFPSDYSDEEVLRSVPKFTFPFVTYHANQPSEHYSFVLTDIDSKFKFAFCLLSVQSSTHTCLCIVSCLPWYEIFYQLLDNLDSIINDSAGRPISVLLDLLHSYRSFKPGEPVSVVAGESQYEKFSFVCPVPNHLASIPESRNLLELVNCLDINNLLVMFASMINERRILIVSEMLSRLTACCHGAAPLLYPMYWQHLYIPVLPPQLLDYCSAPMPYIIGVHSSVMEKVRSQDLGDAVIVNVDTNTITSEYDDLETIPHDVVVTLKRNIKQCLADNKISSRFVAGDGISRAFMTSLVMLIGGYRDALRFHPGEQITFDPDAFILSRPSSIQPFLKRVLQMQTFQQFVSDRLDMLNAGLGFSDEFDVQVNISGDKWGTQSRYKDWLNHMKIQSKKFKREGRDKWLELSGKVKVKSKKAVKEFKMKIDIAKKEDAATTKFESQLHHSVPAKKPPRPPPPTRNYPPTAAPRQSVLMKTPVPRTQHYHVIDVADDVTLSGSAVSWRGGSVERQSFDDSDIVGSLPRPSDMELLSDPDIVNACRKSYSLEDLATIISSADSSSTATNSENDLTLSWVNQSASIVCKPGALSPGIPIPSVASEPNFNTQPDRKANSTNFSSVPRPVPRSSVTGHRSDHIIDDNSVSTEYSSGLLISLDDDKPPSRSVVSTQLPDNIPLTTQSTNYAPVPKPRISKQTDKPSVLNGYADVQWLTTGEALTGSSNTSPQSSPSLNINRSATSFHQSSGSICSRGPFSSGSVKPPMNEARTMFMQSSVPPITNIAPRQSSLDQFDPLSSGQLIVDSSLLSSQAARPDDDDLLKEWDLDFAGLFSGSSSSATSGISGPPPQGAPRPMITSAPTMGFVSMPNLVRPVMSGGVPGRFPGVGSVHSYGPVMRPQWAANSQRGLSSGVRYSQPAIPVLQSMRVLDGGAAKSSTLPPGLTQSSFETSFETSAAKSRELINASSSMVDSFDVLTLNSDTRTEIEPLNMFGGAGVSSSELFVATDKSSIGWEKFE